MTDQLTKRKPYWLFYYLVPACFGILAICVFLNLFNRNFFVGADGYIMQYTATAYAKDWWTQLLQGNWTAIDFTIGEGMDPLLCMTYYGLTDPMSLMYVLFPKSALTFAYGMVTVIKLLLCGLTFGWYAKKHSSDDKAVAMGALVYTFSGFMLFWLFSPGLMSAGYLFPLLLMAMDKAFDEKKYTSLIIWTLITYLTNYYCAMQCSLMLLTYAIIRIAIAKDFTAKTWFGYVKTALAHLLGILASAVVIVPVLYALFGGARDGAGGGYADSMLVFNPDYYLSFFINLFSPLTNSTEYWNAPYQMQGNFLCIAAPALVMFVGHRTAPGSKERRLKYSLLACALFIIVPVFCKLFNGNMYCTHRWAFAFTMVVSIIVVWAVPRFATMGKWTKLFGFLLLVGSTAVSLLNTYPRTAIVSIVVAIIVSLIMFIKPRRLTAYIAACLSMVMMLFLAFVFNTYGVNFVIADVSNLTNTYYYPSVEITDDELDQLIRASSVDSGSAVNVGTLIGYNTTSATWNIMPDGVNEFNADVNAFPMSDVDFWVYGWDDRSALYTAAGVKYFVTDTEHEEFVPYGFELIKTLDVDVSAKQDGSMITTHLVYENQYNVSVGYLLTESMSKDEFYSLNIAERMLALTSHAIVDKAEDTQYSSHSMTIALPCEIDEQTGTITMTFDAPDGYEIYLGVDKIAVTESISQVTVRGLDYWQRKQTSVSGTSDDNTAGGTMVSASQAVITVTDADGTSIEKSIKANMPDSHLTSGHADRTVCLGHNLNGNTTITITFPEKYIAIEGLHVYAMSLAEYNKNASTLEQNSWTDVHSTSRDEKGNYIQGHLAATEDGVFQLAVPYSTGWTAYVDGQKTNIFSCGIKYMGINVTAGEHDIRFEYKTPGITIGLAISIVSILLTGGWFLLEYRATLKRLFHSEKYGPLCKYLVTGCCSTCLDFILYMTLVSIGLWIPVSKMTSGIIVTCLSFIVNRHWSFKASSGNAKQQGVKYFVTQGANIGANTLTNSLVLAACNIKLIAFVCATLVGMTISFTLQKMWVFKKKEDSSSESINHNSVL